MLLLVFDIQIRGRLERRLQSFSIVTQPSNVFENTFLSFATWQSAAGSQQAHNIQFGNKHTDVGRRSGLVRMCTHCDDPVLGVIQNDDLAHSHCLPCAALSQAAAHCQRHPAPHAHHTHVRCLVTIQAQPGSAFAGVTLGVSFFSGDV